MKPVPLFVMEEAAEEAVEARVYLEAARPRLGAAFTASIDDAFKRINANPDLGPSAESANALEAQA